MCKVYAKIICIFNFNAMFFVNFQHYYTLCFHSCASCNKKIVSFNPLAILLYLFSTRLGEIRDYVFLIHVHNNSFIKHSFSLTINDHKHIPFVLIFRDIRHNTSHTIPSGGLLCPTGFVWLCYIHRHTLHTCLRLGMIRQYVGRHKQNTAMLPMFKHEYATHCNFWSVFF
jgi:hypothetical protein